MRKFLCTFVNVNNYLEELLMKRTFTILAAIFMGAMLTSCGQPQESNENSTDMKAQNAVIENIMSRRSIRQYKDGPVARETMETILECGINAPNGMNRQSWEVRVMDNPETVGKLKEYMIQANPQANPEGIAGSFRNAPTLIFVANDLSYDFSAIDCGLLSENIMLSAWSLGVGSVCLGSPIRYIRNSPQALEMLGFSEGYNPIICIGLGYPDENPDAKPRDAGKVKFIE